jgi:Tfp pilus assembly PilM family ATPase
MSVFHGHVGVNLSSSKLELVEVGYKDKIYFLENVDEEYFSEFINFKEKETKIITVLQEALNNILIRKNFNTSNISFSLPSNLFKIFEIPYDSNLHKNDLSNHLLWEFSVLYPSLNKDDYVIRYYQLNENIRKQKLVIVFALERRIINILSKFAGRNNLTLRFVDDEHIASGISANINETISGCVLSVLVSPYYFTLLVSINNQPVYFKRRTIKSFASFEKDFTEEYSLFTKTIKLEEKYEKVFLYGNKYPSSVAEIISEKSESEISYSNPFALIKHSENLKGFNTIKENPTPFSSAAGMAFRLI